MVVGALAFDLYLPARLGTWPLFVVSAMLAVVICFACRFLVNAAAYWMLDPRGVATAWGVGSAVLCGLYFPLRFLPDWLAAALYLGTPVPGMLQIPADVFVERDPPAAGAGLVAVQAIWALAMLAACHAVQRRAERKLVIQGG
jgi:ABC-2 type transport system permease protein